MNKLNKYLGYIFFKAIDENSVKIIRIIDIDNNKENIVIKNLDNGNIENLKFTDISGYTPINPYGFVSFAKVEIDGSEDVIVSLYRLLDIKLDINEPYAICRQSVNDFFYDLINNKNEGIAGVSCTRENCPEGIPYESLAYCDKLDSFKIVNFYLTDTLDDILSCINTKKYDNTLEKLYNIHMNSVNPAYDKSTDKNISHNGWCRNLKTLLTENNFINDIDTMRNVTAVDFKINDNINIKKSSDGLEVPYLDETAIVFFSNVFKLGIKDAIAIEYDFDIDLSEFNNTKYFLVRDNDNKTYVIQYTLNAEYRQDELYSKANTLSGIDKLRLAFYEKYNKK